MLVAHTCTTLLEISCRGSFVLITRLVSERKQKGGRNIAQIDAATTDYPFYDYGDILCAYFALFEWPSSFAALP